MTISNENLSRKVKSRIKKSNLVKLLAVPLAVTMLGAITPASFGALESDDVGMYGSILVSRKAHSAATSMKQGRYGEAQGQYKALIGQNPKEDDFYFGYYEASRKLRQWPEVALALEQLFQHNPRYKDKMTLEYGECLYHMNRYSEAEPVLKKALAKVDQPSIVEKQLKKLMRKSIIIRKKHIGKVVVPKLIVHKAPAPRIEAEEEASHPHTSDVDLNVKAAFLKSESILVCVYKGFEKDKFVSFYRPPKAKYKIIEYLKGPPLNKHLPVRYEFHDKTDKGKPKGWEFKGRKSMPKVGSKWIIFIPNAVPVDGMFETYHGSYGRMAYDGDSIDRVLRILEQHKGQTR